MDVFRPQQKESAAQRIARWILGGTMMLSGLSHLTFARRAFRAQVPRFVPKLLPVTVDQVVLWSGLVEISIGASLLLFPKQRRAIGWALGVFYIAIFPGNLAQWIHQRDAFGLDTDDRRFVRLFGQPVLVAWALWSTGAFEALRDGQLLDEEKA